MSNWFYAANGQQQGPFGDAQLRDLISNGTVRPDTLVWTEGMAGWQKAAEVPGLKRPYCGGRGSRLYRDGRIQPQMISLTPATFLCHLHRKMPDFDWQTARGSQTAQNMME